MVIETKNNKIRGLYMDKHGNVHPVIQSGRKIGLLEYDHEERDIAIEFIKAVTGVDYFYAPRKGFWAGSDLVKIIKMAGGKCMILRANMYYSLKNIRCGADRYATYIKALKQ